MNYKRHEKKNGTVSIDFEIDAKEWEVEVEKAYQKNKGKYKKEGFRPGRVPRKVLENNYGEFLFYEDAFNDSFPDFFAKMVKKEKDIIPVDYPDVKINKMDKSGVSFVATVSLLPEFKLEKYTGFTVEKKKIEVSKSEITKQIEELRQKNARFVDIVDRAVQKGDLVNLDFEGSVDGKVFEGGTAKDHELEIGSKSFIDGFEDQMIGMQIGEEKDLKVKFPESYHSNALAGKDAVFAVKVLSIREKQIPSLDDEFVKDTTEFSSLTELSLDIESKLATEKERVSQRKVEEDLVSKIVEGVDFVIPEAMITRQLDFMVEDVANKVVQYGLDKDKYFELMGTTEEKFRKDSHSQAKNAVKTSLVLEEIIKLEKITVSEKDVEAKFEEIAKQYSMPIEEIKKAFVGNNINNIKQDILGSKVVEFLKANNSIVDADTTAKKISKK